MLNNLNIALEWYTKSFIGETHFTFVDWLCKLHELKTNFKQVLHRKTNNAYYIKSNNGDRPMVTHINLNRTFFSSSSNTSLSEIWDGLSEPCSEFPLSASSRNSSTPVADLLSVCSGFKEK